MTSSPPQDPLVCLCAPVPESVVLAARASGVRDVPALRRPTAASTGWGDCLTDLEELLNE
ncbi:(2Fe-2S)-binding protein [Streptomyces sp. SID12501]|uniref:Nitrite reductase n=1 Tax=Streptomyces sp. SID12501 TaxID=2706042 RepID=A0A6B3BVM8_9ACTN|nr:(2Fe-2S)-binding protein [Streptomyces sp. SID12501]NEC88389.1 nitrite reductase [Streptomyces sp. SID12501]